MTLTSLEEFDRKNAKKRERLLKDHALAHALPTCGHVVTWTGEGGWKPDGNTHKPDVQRSIDLAPWLVHSPFRGAEHVAFRAPDSLAGDAGEHVSSKHRSEFVRRYLTALLDACEPHMIDMLAIKGRYASMVPESFDYAADKDYEDAEELSRGLYEVTATTGRGYPSHAELSFYIRTEKTGPCQVSFELDGFGGVWKLAPCARYTNESHNALVRSWDIPKNTGACHVFKRGAGDDKYIDGVRVPQSFTLEWLFDTREAMATAIGLTAS